VLGNRRAARSFISAQTSSPPRRVRRQPRGTRQTIELGGRAVSPLEVVRLAESISGRPTWSNMFPGIALEQQARDGAGTDASIFPSLMLCQTRGDEIGPCPDWLQPTTSVEDYLAASSPCVKG